MYRQFLRGAKQIRERALREDVEQQVRNSFRNSRQVQDISTIRNLLKEGNRYMLQLEAMGAGKSSSSSSSSVSTSSAGAGQGWLESGDGEDVRGRVGVSFPWQK